MGLDPGVKPSKSRAETAKGSLCHSASYPSQAVGQKEGNLFWPH